MDGLSIEVRMTGTDIDIANYTAIACLRLAQQITGREITGSVAFEEREGSSWMRIEWEPAVG